MRLGSDINCFRPPRAQVEYNSFGLTFDSREQIAKRRVTSYIINSFSHAACQQFRFNCAIARDEMTPSPAGYLILKGAKSSGICSLISSRRRGYPVFTRRLRVRRNRVRACVTRRNRDRIHSGAAVYPCARYCAFAIK